MADKNGVFSIEKAIFHHEAHEDHEGEKIFKNF
jgi:hypothetical protein